MSIRIVRAPVAGTPTIPDDALLFFNEATNEYYIITMSGEVLTWEAV